MLLTHTPWRCWLILYYNKCLTMSIFDDDSIWAWVPPRRYLDGYRVTSEHVLFGMDEWWLNKDLLARVRLPEEAVIENWDVAKRDVSRRDLTVFVNLDGMYHDPQLVDEKEFPHVRNYLRELITNMYIVGAGCATTLSTININDHYEMCDRLRDTDHALVKCTGSGCFNIFKKILVRLLDVEDAYDVHAARPKAEGIRVPIFSPGWQLMKDTAKRVVDVFRSHGEIQISCQYLPVRANAGLYLVADPFWKGSYDNLNENYGRNCGVYVLRSADSPLINLVKSYLDPAGKNYDPWAQPSVGKIKYHMDKLQELIKSMVSRGHILSQALDGYPIYDKNFMVAWENMQRHVILDAGVTTLVVYKDQVLALMRKQREYLFCWQVREDLDDHDSIFVQKPGRWLAIAVKK